MCVPIVVGKLFDILVKSDGTPADIVEGDR